VVLNKRLNLTEGITEIIFGEDKGPRISIKKLKSVKTEFDKLMQAPAVKTAEWRLGLSKIISSLIDIEKGR
jgi:hypothetical protein